MDNLIDGLSKKERIPERDLFLKMISSDFQMLQQVYDSMGHKPNGYINSADSKRLKVCAITLLGEDYDENDEIVTVLAKCRREMLRLLKQLSIEKSSYMDEEDEIRKFIKIKDIEDG